MLLLKVGIDFPHSHIKQIGYELFNFIVAGMWGSPVHRQAVVDESKSGNQFVKFINMLMNDTTFLLDESLESLKRIHDIQLLIADDDKW